MNNTVTKEFSAVDVNKQRAAEYKTLFKLSAEELERIIIRSDTKQEQQ